MNSAPEGTSTKSFALEETSGNPLLTPLPEIVTGTLVPTVPTGWMLRQLVIVLAEALATAPNRTTSAISSAMETALPRTRRETVLRRIEKAPHSIRTGPSPSQLPQAARSPPIS